MKRSVLHRLIRRQERLLAAPLDYLREIADHSPTAFLKLAMIAPVGVHRQELPADAWHVARVTAALAEDCGTCVQIAITLARREGISAMWLKAAIAGDAAAFPEPLRDVYEYTRALSERRDDPQLRARIRAHYGQTALIELALAAAVARVIPTIKRALGHSQSCALLRFDLLESAAHA